MANRPEWRHSNKLGLHTPTGRAFGIIQRAAKSDPLRKRQLGKNLFPVCVVKVFQNVDSVIRVQLTDTSGDLVIRHLLDDIQTDRLIDLRQGGHVEIVTQQTHQRVALFRQNGFEQIAKFGLVQPCDIFTQEQQITIGDRRTNHRQKIGANRPVFRINIRGFRRSVRVQRLVTIFVQIGHCRPLFCMNAPEKRAGWRMALKTALSTMRQDGCR
ncbi:hypothetical protein D3C80_1151410 [compost metagenome]